MPNTSSNKDSAFKKFIKENKSLAFMLPLLAVLIIVVIIIYSSGGGKEKTSSASNTPTATVQPITTPASKEPDVEVLPQTERTSDKEPTDASVVKDPFESPMKLSGVLTYSNGDATAIIESGGVSHIVRKDDWVGNTTWKVVGIDKTSVLLDSNGRSLMLELAAANTNASSGTASGTASTTQ